MISTLDDLRAWARVLATGKLLSRATMLEQHKFLPAPQFGQGAFYGLALENDNGWIGHNGNVLGFMAFPYYLPDEKMTMVVLANSSVDVEETTLMVQDITRIISPKHIYPELPTAE